MIRAFLISELEARFPDRPFHAGSYPEADITFSAAHAEVGDLKIYDDGSEARIEITKITHGHFGCYEEDLNQEQREKEIAILVADFVKDVFDEKVILFATMGGQMGGWRVRKANEIQAPSRPLTKYFTWSGPLNP